MNIDWNENDFDNPNIFNNIFTITSQREVKTVKNEKYLNNLLEARGARPVVSRGS